MENHCYVVYRLHIFIATLSGYNYNKRLVTTDYKNKTTEYLHRKVFHFYIDKLISRTKLFKNLMF